VAADADFLNGMIAAVGQQEALAHGLAFEVVRQRASQLLEKERT